MEWQVGDLHLGKWKVAIRIIVIDGALRDCRIGKTVK
uniref:MIP06864p n=1 Tax=Drosophila melanogaster TaxID=7227 RepID=C0PUZ3_DROME|nr:MIP06864p [Drosophila melanogaster]